MARRTTAAAAATITIAAALLTGCTNPAASSGESAGSAADRCAEERAAKADQPIKVGVALAGLNTNPIFIDVVAAVKEAANADDVEILTADATDPEAGVRGIENFINADVDVILTQIFQKDLIAPLVPRIQEKCIVFGSYDAETPEAEYSIFADNFELGRLIGTQGGEWMTEHSDGKGEGAIFSYDPLDFIKERGDGIAEGFKEACPDCEIARRFETAGTPEQGLAAAENLLQANPDVKVIMSIVDGGVLGAYEAYKAAGLNDPESDLALFGCDASEDGLNAIKEGGIFRGTIYLDVVTEFVGLYERSVETARTGVVDEDARVVEYPMTAITLDNIDVAA